MKNKIKTMALFFFFISFLLLLLTDAKQAVSFSLSGLLAWFNSMIPTLFPFMVLGGMMLRTGFSTKLSGVIYPVAGRIFGLSKDCIYIMVMGFLCGFPMGAVLISESIRLSKITREEGELLAAFCNNIGPIYFISFVLANCPMGRNKYCLFIMYGVPLLYGLLLRYTAFYYKIPCKRKKILSSAPPSFSLFEAFEASLEKSIESITKLGAYMVFFNAMTIFISNSFLMLPEAVRGILGCLLEISGGIKRLKLSALYPTVYMLLPLGGACCIAQTAGIFKSCHISMKKYVFHKLLQTLITAGIYLFL